MGVQSGIDVVAVVKLAWLLLLVLVTNYEEG
jgi:hypothetical protein